MKSKWEKPSEKIVLILGEEQETLQIETPYCIWNNSDYYTTVN